LNSHHLIFFFRQSLFTIFQLLFSFDNLKKFLFLHFQPNPPAFFISESFLFPPPQIYGVPTPLLLYKKVSGGAKFEVGGGIWGSGGVAGRSLETQILGGFCDMLLCKNSKNKAHKDNVFCIMRAKKFGCEDQYDCVEKT
jgi:hypothetical protein